MSEGETPAPQNTLRTELLRTAQWPADGSAPSSAAGAGPLEVPSTVSIPGYDVLCELNHGGQGVIYRAIQQATKQEVAIKILLEGPYAGVAARRRFEREIELVAQLKHPHIVSVFHAGQTSDGRQFYVMEYIHGTPLVTYVREQKLSMEEALRLFAEVCEAVQFAHQRGIIHRDLKPSNILVDANGEPKILDFGLAKWLAAPADPLLSFSNQMMGTLAYMSPEQARGRMDEIDTRTDIYALGVILYQILTGGFPYPVDGDVTTVLRCIAEEEPTPPSRKWNAQAGIPSYSRRRSAAVSSAGWPRRARGCPVDDEVETIVLKALAKARARRYQSAGELARDIGHYLDGEPIEARRDSAWYVLTKQLRRYRAPVAVAAAFVLLVGVFGVAMSLLAAREHAERQRADDEAREADRQAEALRWRDYVNTIALADAAGRNCETARLRQLLERCQPDVRGWEWYRLKYLADRSLLVLRGHEAAVNTVAFSPDDQWLASGGDDGTVRIWNAATGALLHTCSDGGGSVQQMCFDPGSDYVVSGAARHGERVGLVRLWNVATGATELALELPLQEVRQVAFSPDGQRVYALLVGPRRWQDEAGNWYSDERSYGVKAWAVPAGDEVATAADELAGAAAVDRPDAVELLPESDELLLSTRRVVGQTVAGVFCRRTELRLRRAKITTAGPVLEQRVALDTGAPLAGFALDEQMIIGTDARSNDLVVFDSAAGRLLGRLQGHLAPGARARFSRDGGLIATAAADGLLKLWRVSDLQERVTLRGHEGPIAAVSISADNRRIATAGADHTVRIWDALAEREVLEVPGSGAVRSLAFSPDGRTLAAFGLEPRSVVFLDASSFYQTGTLSGEPGNENPVGAFSHSGRVVATASARGRIGVFDADTFLPYRRLETNRPPDFVAFSPDDEWFFVNVVAEADERGRPLSGELLRWPVSTAGEVQTLKALEHSEYFIALSGDTRYAVSSAGADGTIHLWDVATARRLRRVGMLSAPANVAQFSPDGTKLIVGGDWGVARLWPLDPRQPERDVEARPERGASFYGHAGLVTAAAFSPDGGRVATADTSGVVRLWDTQTGLETYDLVGSHFQAVVALAFSPDGETLVAGTADGLRIWRTASRSPARSGDAGP